MPLLISYSGKNVLARKLTTALTLSGITLVVFVFCGMLMLTHGLEQTLVGTGYDENCIVIRRSSKSEIMSIVDREMANIIRTDPAIAIDSAGLPLCASEILVLINRPKRKSDKPSNVPVRGVMKASWAIRPGLKLIEGRMWKPGTSEIIAGAKVAGTFQGCGMGETVRFGMREWTVVGIFSSAGSGFESELWGDVDQLMDAFGRPVFSSVTMKLNSPADLPAMKSRLENDPRLTIELQAEKEYYANQTQALSAIISILGVAISIVFSLGAMVGAMITMYASVAGRTVEIGTLRALGFSRRSVLSAFLFESVLISLLGGAIGVTAAFFLRYLSVSTTNWDTFSELAFSFEMSPSIAANSLFFAIVMGIIGGFLPAVRAARLKTISALRAK